MYAAVLSLLGKRFFVVHAANGMDEISPVGTTTLWDGTGREQTLSMADFGLPEHSLASLASATTAAANAQRWRALLDDSASDTPLLDWVSANAGAALVLAGELFPLLCSVCFVVCSPSPGLATDWAEGAKKAKTALQSGAVKRAFSVAI